MVPIIVWWLLGPSAEFREISSLFSLSPFLLAISAGSAALSPCSLASNWCRCKLWNWRTALASFFERAYKRAASRLWGRRGRRFLVALLSPPLPSHWSAQSWTAPLNRSSREHQLTLHPRKRIALYVRLLCFSVALRGHGSSAALAQVRKSTAEFLESGNFS